MSPLVVCQLWENVFNDCVVSKANRKNYLCAHDKSTSDLIVLQRKIKGNQKMSSGVSDLVLFGWMDGWQPFRQKLNDFSPELQICFAAEEVYIERNDLSESDWWTAEITSLPQHLVRCLVNAEAICFVMFGLIILELKWPERSTERAFASWSNFKSNLIIFFLR